MARVAFLYWAPDWRLRDPCACPGAQVAAALPGPGEANTLFAPTDSAFFNMLTTLREFDPRSRVAF